MTQPDITALGRTGTSADLPAEDPDGDQPSDWGCEAAMPYLMASWCLQDGCRPTSAEQAGP